MEAWDWPPQTSPCLTDGTPSGGSPRWQEACAASSSRPQSLVVPRPPAPGPEIPMSRSNDSCIDDSMYCAAV